LEICKEKNSPAESGIFLNIPKNPYRNGYFREKGLTTEKNVANIITISKALTGTKNSRNFVERVAGW
jgi:hypothetical protein